MNVKISVLVICFEAIIYLLLYNLHDCIFLYPSTKKLYCIFTQKLLEEAQDLAALYVVSLQIY